MVQGRYLIVQMIGSGDSGEVYLAVDQWSGSAVTLKRTVFGSDTGLRDALEVRSKQLLNLRHPVLPKVNDSFVEDGQHFLAMEHISGPDLAIRLEEAKKPFPLSWCMFWADQLLDALTYLHSHTPAIIHGDIKPANLKLTDENHLVLLDQGLTGGRNVSELDGDRKASPYASIEQIRGMPMNAASDIYSFAATFYQLMTNVVPPDARKRADAVRSGLPDPLVSLSKANPEIAIDVSEVIERGLAIAPEQRFAVAAEMQRSLRRSFKRVKEGTTATTVEFQQGGQPTVGMQGQGDGIVADPADAVTVTDEPTTDAMYEVPTRTHVETPAASTVPEVIMEAKAEPTVTLNTADAQTELTPQSVTTESYPVGHLTEVAPEPVPAAVPPATPNTAVAAAASAAPTQAFSQPQAAGKPPVKKSRAGLILGGLVALLLIACVAGAGGWYFYKNYYKATKVTPSPSPSPAVVASPSPETEMASDSNINSNSNSEQVSNANTTDTNSNKGTVASSTPAPAKPPQTAPGKTNPVRTSQPPNARPSAKPKSGDDRTVILQ